MHFCSTGVWRLWLWGWRGIQRMLWLWLSSWRHTLRCRDWFCSGDILPFQHVDCSLIPHLGLGMRLCGTIRSHNTFSRTGYSLCRCSVCTIQDFLPILTMRWPRSRWRTSLEWSHLSCMEGCTMASRWWRWVGICVYWLLVSEATALNGKKTGIQNSVNSNFDDRRGLVSSKSGLTRTSTQHWTIIALIVIIIHGIIICSALATVGNCCSMCACWSGSGDSTLQSVGSWQLLCSITPLFISHSVSAAQYYICVMLGQQKHCEQWTEVDESNAVYMVLQL